MVSKRQRTSRAMWPLRSPAIGIAAVLLIASGCSDASDDPPPDIEVAADDVASSASELSAELADVLRDNGLASAASAIELVDFTALTDASEFTFLAPNDAAFLELDADQAADLLADPEAIADVLRNHTVSTRLEADDIAATDSVETERGKSLAVTADGDSLRIGDATVVEADIQVGSGVVHIVDRLAIP